jgi:DNA-binding MarR family transcriptional regulator
MRGSMPIEPDQIDELIEKFWESVPPAWHNTRAYIRHVAAEKFSMTTEQFQVLRRIRRGIDSVSALADANRTSRSSVSKAVDALVNKGLVSRLTDTDDRRLVHLTLTSEGQRLLKEVYDQAEAWLREKFQTLTPAELTLLLDAMQILQKTFNESIQS